MVERLPAYPKIASLHGFVADVGRFFERNPKSSAINRWSEGLIFIATSHCFFDLRKF
jgi:hypothetical protein